MHHADLSCDLLHMDQIPVAINYWDQQFILVAINYLTPQIFRAFSQITRLQVN